MRIELYSLVGCPTCVELKNYFEKENISYDEIIVPEDITQEEFSEKFKNVNGFPFVVIDDEPIGYYDQTMRYILRKKKYDKIKDFGEL